MDQSFLGMTVPKRTSDYFEDFDFDFQAAARRQVGLSRILLEYLLRNNNTGNYDVIWNSKEEKLNNCVIFVGQYYKEYSESLYTILVQHVHTLEPGLNKSHCKT